MSEREREESSRKGFVVVDRRGRSEESEPARTESTKAESPKTGAPPRREAPTEPPPALHADEPLPPLDFSAFVHSLAISALHHLGLVPDPETGEPAAPNLDLARQNIDILALLEVKTRGNLDADESRLLESLLYELRMRFVEASGTRPR